MWIRVNGFVFDPLIETPRLDRRLKTFPVDGVRSIEPESGYYLVQFVGSVDYRWEETLVQLGLVEGAQDAIVMGAERELELHLDPAAGRRAAAADAVAAAARRRHAVHRPGDRLKERGLPRSVRPDDSGEPGTELQLGMLVLAEVDEAQAADLHQPPASSRSTLSIKDSPS